MKRITLAIAVPLLVCLAACTRDPKEDAKKYVETGNKYYEKGKLKEASIMYRRALQRNMRDPQAHYRLALVEMQMGMVGEARRSLLRATDLDPNNMDALSKLGEVDAAIYQSDPVTLRSYLDDVQEIAKKLLARDPRSFDGLKLSAFIAARSGDIPGAISKLQEAVRVRPGEPGETLTLARLLDANKQGDEAEKIAKQLIDKHKDFEPIYDYLYVKYASANRVSDAEEILKRKVANNPKSGQDVAQLAFHYYLSKRPDQMDAMIQKLDSDPKTFPNGRLLVGDLLMRIGSLDRALAEYQQGEKSDSRNKLTYAKREVQVLTKQGRNSDAEKILARVLQQTPNDIETVTMHASMLLRSGDQKQVQKAIDEMQRVVAATPQAQTAALEALHYNLGRAYQAKGDPASLDQARVQYEASLTISKDKYTPAKLALADLLLSRGDTTKAIQQADEVIQQDPNSLPPRLVRTRALITMGEVQKARQELAALAHASPNSPEVRYQLAVLDLADRRYKEAEDGFGVLIKLKDPRGLRGIVESKIRQGEYDNAIKLVQNRIQETPDNMDLHRFLAELEIRGNRINEAVAEYQFITKKEPTAENYERLGEFQEVANQRDAALSSYTEARQLKPNDAKALVRIAIIYDKSGKAEDARKAYDEVLRLQPDNPYALNNVAYRKAEAGVDLDQALTYAERARQKLPNDPNVSDTVGLIYLRKNLVEDSVRILGDLVKRAPERAAYHIHYAAALVQKGDKATARKELEQAVRTGPTEQEKQRIEELRRQLST